MLFSRERATKAGETEPQTAVRECQEEVGISLMSRCHNT
ncbi:unnamed protein product [Ectocarpus sp. 4 AP-2014]